MVEYNNILQTYHVLLVTINVTLALAVMLAACVCCRRKVQKNELLGLEGMVKLTNPDEVIIINTVGTSESQADLNLSTISNADSEKRASTAAHRSLPDIPVAEANGDNGSELYETVADKRLMDAQNNQHKSPTPSLKKQTSVSQHSSISQADDVSSPYSRVKNSPHDYAKVRSTEHPYAQLNAPSTSGGGSVAAGVHSSSQITLNNDSLNRNSHHSGSSQHLNESVESQVEIPAASAIAGMISASQDLPYMTPPISNQHFSGDSQDSSKGYTSISVREPLANILAQQPPKHVQRNATMSRDVNDSHYATVSDDSDETYAAIEDPNGRNNPNTVADIYTSGSETYAQIQPMQSMNSIVVSVEINNASASSLTPSTSSVAAAATASSVSANHSQTQLEHSVSASHTGHNSFSHTRPTTTTPTSSSAADHGHLSHTPIPPPVDSLRAQMHSRQASSSSNNSSSVGNLGSPKPEKRQANSPLPPTPKSTTASQHQLHATSGGSNLTSGRNSVISVIECGGGGALETSGSVAGGVAIAAAAAATAASGADGSPQKKNKSLSPSKDIEGMYAKVMKKNKFARNSPSSQNNSPILERKHNDHHAASSSLGVSPLDSAAADLMEAHKSTISTNIATEKSRMRSNSYNAKDHGYETIPADAMRSGGAVIGAENRKSDCYANILQKERQQEGAHLPNATNKHSTSYHHPSNAKPPNDAEQQQQQQRVYRSEKHYETIAGPTTAADAKKNKNSNDPGYETLHTPKNQQKQTQSDPDSENKKSSDYDPNYEVLHGPKGGRSGGLSDDGYAKVIDKKRSLTIDEEEDDDATDGYSKVKGQAELEEDEEDGAIGGYSTIGGAAGTAAAATTEHNHNYASILEAKAGGGNKEDEDATETDHYARIAEARIPAAPPPDLLPLPLSAVSTPTKTAKDPPARLPEQLPPVTSPTPSANSSSMQLLLNNSSSVASYSNTTMTTTTSNSTMSSRQTPSSFSSSQYESLTGSDTDPNYESVCYLNTSSSRGGGGGSGGSHESSSENPYERLQTSSSDTQLSPLTPEDGHRKTATADSSGSGAAPEQTTSPTVTVKTSANGLKPHSTANDLSGSSTTEVVVDDYFQV